VGLRDRYAEVRGEVTRTTTGPEAREHIDELSRKYNGADYPPDNIKSERVILWVTPQRQTIVDQKDRSAPRTETARNGYLDLVRNPGTEGPA
jgi:hypothetical protein